MESVSASVECHLLPGLPHDLALACISRLALWDLPAARCVSRGWVAAIRSASFGRLRRRVRAEEGGERAMAARVQLASDCSGSPAAPAKPAVPTEQATHAAAPATLPVPAKPTARATHANPAKPAAGTGRRRTSVAAAPPTHPPPGGAACLRFPPPTPTPTQPATALLPP
ncbi:unnamed protein product [Closterium sp. Yama58-4]|nr:unnamed protein product [Closterium sp. Yama58-4]